MHLLQDVLLVEYELHYQLYEIAIKNGFVGSEKDWLAQLGTSSHFERTITTYESEIEGQTEFVEEFNEQIQYSEDADWVKRYSAKVAYVADAVVEHSHNYTLKEVKKRFFNEGVADRQMGKKSPGLLSTWKSILAETLRDWIYLVKHGAFKEFFYAPVYRYVQKINYWRGTQQ